MEGVVLGTVLTVRNLFPGGEVESDPKFEISAPGANSMI